MKQLIHDCLIHPFFRRLAVNPLTAKPLGREAVTNRYDYGRWNYLSFWFFVLCVALLLLKTSAHQVFLLWWVVGEWEW